MVVITRQTVEFPKINSIKPASLRVRAQLVESLSIQAPAIRRSVAVDGHYCPTAFRNVLTTAIFLRLLDRLATDAILQDHLDEFGDLPPFVKRILARSSRFLLEH
jgi:hypothetical protein